MLIKTNEFSWLPTSITKGEPILPKIVFEEPRGQGYAGYYRHESDILVVVEAEEGLESTIAHELCHFLQEKQGRLPLDDGPLDFSIPYTQMIHKYFTSYWWEMEALLFEVKHTPNWYNLWWLNKLVKEG